MGVNYVDVWFSILNHFYPNDPVFSPTFLKERSFYFVYLNRTVHIKGVHECVGM